MLDHGKVMLMRAIVIIIIITLIMGVIVIIIVIVIRMIITIIIIIIIIIIITSYVSDGPEAALPRERRSEQALPRLQGPRRGCAPGGVFHWGFIYNFPNYNFKHNIETVESNIARGVFNQILYKIRVLFKHV